MQQLLGCKKRNPTRLQTFRFGLQTLTGIGSGSIDYLSPNLHSRLCAEGKKLFYPEYY